MRRPSLVKVTRPDPVTGELIEELVRPSHFRPRPPRRPKLTAPRRQWGPGAVGVHWLAIHDLREKEWLYWEGYRHRLTAAERFEIADGATSVIRPLAQDWEHGELLEVTHDVTAEVLETRWLKRRLGGPFDVDLQYRTTFLVKDQRPLLLRRGTIGSGTPPLDKFGNPRPPEQEEIEQARVESAYTTTPSRAIDDAGEEIDETLHRHLHREQSASNARRQATLTRAQKIERLERRIREAEVRYERSMVRILTRQLQLLQRPRAA